MYWHVNDNALAAAGLPPLVVVLVGIVSLIGLPIAQYPNVTPPTISVTAIYPGANAVTVADTVAMQTLPVSPAPQLSSRRTRGSTQARSRSASRLPMMSRSESISRKVTPKYMSF